MSAPEYSLLLAVLAGSCVVAAAFARRSGNSKRDVTLIASFGAFIAIAAVGVHSI